MDILFQFGVSALAIVVAGFHLSKYANTISELTGWGKLLVGSLLLAGATSLPELAVDIKAVRQGLPDLAVGDLLGSSLFNLLILAILDFAYPSQFRRTAFSPKNLHHSISAVMTILLTSLVGLWISSQLQVNILGLSAFAWLIIFVYLYGLRLNSSINHSAQTEPSPHELEPAQKRKLIFFCFLGFAAASLVIIFASPWFVEAADLMAQRSGLGHTFLGSTLVALSTSLPELIATLSAFRMGSPDLALGNIFGSNAFNMLLFVPLEIVYPGELLLDVKQIHLVSVFGIIFAMSVAVLGQIYRKKERSRFTEPSSEVVTGVILSVLLLLYYLSQRVQT